MKIKTHVIPMISLGCQPAVEMGLLFPVKERISSKSWREGKRTISRHVKHIPAYPTKDWDDYKYRGHWSEQVVELKVVGGSVTVVPVVGSMWKHNGLLSKMPRFRAHSSELRCETEPFTPAFMVVEEGVDPIEVVMAEKLASIPKLPVAQSRPLPVIVKPASGTLLERCAALRAKKAGVIPSVVRREKRQAAWSQAFIVPVFPMKSALL